VLHGLAIVGVVLGLFGLGAGCTETMSAGDDEGMGSASGAGSPSGAPSTGGGGSGQTGSGQATGGGPSGEGSQGTGSGAGGSAAGQGSGGEAPGSGSDAGSPACDLRCPPNLRCELQEVVCIRAPCDPVPTCVELTFDAGTSDPALEVNCIGPVLCAAVPVSCPEGQVSEIRNGCYEGCVPIESCSCTGPEHCPDSNRYTCHLSAGHCGPYL
jgi:hypothetical protein